MSAGMRSAIAGGICAAGRVGIKEVSAWPTRPRAFSGSSLSGRDVVKAMSRGSSVRTVCSSEDVRGTFRRRERMQFTAIEAV